jgi:hypothetical protein
MSLILDALRKLEREKAAHEPGVLIVGSVPWGGTSRTIHLRLAAGAAAVLAAGVFVGWLLRPAVPPPATAALPAATPAAAQPTPRPTPTLLPPAPVATTGARYEVPAAPPVRLSRPVPAAPARADRVQSALPDPTPAVPTPEPAAETLPAPVPAESISVAPGAAGVIETAPAAAPDELRLTAISQRDGRPVALINDRLVFEGDSFDGVRVLRIGETEVEVEVRGVRRVLRF